jgi:hypothetical protein
MRLVFVTHCHPDTPHVCATRMREFAAACARAGHQVVLLTETLPDCAADLGPAEVPAALAAHDWAMPFRLACAPMGNRLVAALREGRVPRALRRPLLAAAYLIRSGLFTDWRDGSAPYWPVLARHFHPDCIWANFGNTDSLAIARGIAKAAGCRWVMDIKDPWSVFIPPPLRRLLVGRFADFAAATALSAQHAADLRDWFGRDALVLPSGIDALLLAPLPAPPGDLTRLLVIGGLYNGVHLDALLDGIARWRSGVAGPVALTYAGGEAARFQAAARHLGLIVETPGYLDLEELRALAGSSHALLYVRNPAALYQHKLVELLAFERPILCLPAEASEAIAMAAELGGTLHSCGDAGALALGLGELVGRRAAINRDKLDGYTWDVQARKLVTVLEGAA